MLAVSQRSQLLVIDVQEKLAPHIANREQVIAGSAKLLRYARRLGVPATITEHYSAGLGATVPLLRDAAGNDAPRLEKIAFSSWRDDAIRDRVGGLVDRGRDQVVIAGMESHVCVLQTVLDLLDHGASVFLVADATGSREASVRDVAVRRMEAAGASVVTQEMVAFEWLERGGTPEFKDLTGIVKS